MNTITVQLNDKQYDFLDNLLGKLTEDAEQTPSDNYEILADLWRDFNTTKRYIWCDGMTLIELEIPAEAVDDIAQPGDNGPAVLRWLDPDQPNHLQAQFALLSSCDMRHALEDAGIENVDAMPDEVVEQYTLWMACHDIAEERNQED